MVISLSMYGTLPLVAFGAGVMSAISGGSGMVILPTLLLVGVPPHIALGTNKLFTTTGLLTSSLTFIRAGLFKPRLWLAASVASVLGALGGAIIAMIISNEHLTFFLPLILLVTIGFLLLPQPVVVKAKRQYQPNSKAAKLSALSLGLYSGFLGAGTGTIWMLIAMNLFGVDIIEASAISRFMCFLANLAALIVFVCLHQVDYALGLSLAAMSIVGAFIGTKVAIAQGRKLIKPTVFVVVCIMMLKLMYKHWI